MRIWIAPSPVLAVTVSLPFSGPVNVNVRAWHSSKAALRACRQVMESQWDGRI